MIRDSHSDRKPTRNEHPSRHCAPSLSDQTVLPPATWQQAPAPGDDPLLRATQYLGLLRELAVQPSWISLDHIADPPGVALIWIGHHIHQVNQQLNAVLSDLLACFEAAQRPRVQIFAAPIATQAGVDGFCRDRSLTTLMVDPGRIVPADWPGLVAHELAHAVAGASGHGAEFAQAIAHLCLAQDLPVPAPNADAETLSHWPPCRRNPDPKQFWLGQTAWQLEL
ncbi:hypothetical protein IQ265_05585 [Nodosilinea sp. LEGE 06152]|uniref:hypothetical protein n=1 Tax=Nodosilinea sp. LEGE 06152 TaxID=2777966 RepID=UPI00188162BD|nr:hypothetical protein [Nodosilinea sp. LEGE 06152]MBE9156303.1 hypothetical protein [Nodosilinea sp. LEGE 06152]